VKAVRIMAAHIKTPVNNIFAGYGKLLFVFLPLKGKQIEK